MTAYWEIAAHSAYDAFSKYKYLIANLAFSNLGISFSLRLSHCHTSVVVLVALRLGVKTFCAVGALYTCMFSYFS